MFWIGVVGAGAAIAAAILIGALWPFYLVGLFAAAGACWIYDHTKKA